MKNALLAALVLAPWSCATRHPTTPAVPEPVPVVTDSGTTVVLDGRPAATVWRFGDPEPENTFPVPVRLTGDTVRWTVTFCVHPEDGVPEEEWVVHCVGSTWEEKDK